MKDSTNLVLNNIYIKEFFIRIKDNADKASNIC